MSTEPNDKNEIDDDLGVSLCTCGHYDASHSGITTECTRCGCEGFALRPKWSDFKREPTAEELSIVLRLLGDALAENAAMEQDVARIRARLTSVLELHQEDDGNCAHCHMNDFPVPFPCPTVRAARGEEG